MEMWYFKGIASILNINNH